MRTRYLLSYAALLVATLICIAEGHVHIVLAEPATYMNFLHHRCGLLFLGCLGWAMLGGALQARSIRPI